MIDHFYILFRRLLMKKKIIIAVIAIIAIIVVATIGMGAYIFIPRTSKTKDIQKYGRFDKFQNYEMMSDLLIFPDVIEKDNIDDYYYFYREYLFGAKCQVYLKCTYNDAQFVEEKERLANINIETNWDAKNESKYDDNSFIYPAYVLSNGLENTYEYALLDESNHSIYYIFLHDISQNGVKFNDELLPNDYQYASDTKELFNIHMFDVNGVYKTEVKSKVETRTVK